VLDYSVLIENLVQNLKRPAAIDHVVFRDDLEPVHYGLSRQNMPVVRNPKADSYSMIRKAIEAISRHEGTPKY
jgi:hypothetical protein